MDIPVKTYDNGTMSAKINFDDSGNLYFEFSHNDEFKDKEFTLYQVDIDGKGDMILDLADYKIIDSKKHLFGKIHQDKSKTSKSHVLMDKEDSDADDENDDDEDPYGSVSEKYYPEEKGYFYSIPTENYHQSSFHFCQTSDIVIPVNTRTNGDVLALYDTHIYDDSSNLVFRSKLLGEPPLYIVKVHQNGNVTYREICNVDGCKHYSLFVDKDNNVTLQYN